MKKMTMPLITRKTTVAIIKIYKGTSLRINLVFYVSDNEKVTAIMIPKIAIIVRLKNTII
jgi:hypothetical protein